MLIAIVMKFSKIFTVCNFPVLVIYVHKSCTQVRTKMLLKYILQNFSWIIEVVWMMLPLASTRLPLPSWSHLQLSWNTGFQWPLTKNLAMRAVRFYGRAWMTKENIKHKITIICLSVRFVQNDYPDFGFPW